jgi:periplasmic protein TonB
VTRSEFNGVSPNAHLLIGQMPAPHQFRGPGWEGTGVSIAAHAILFGILAYAATHVPQVAQTASDVTGRLKVFLDRPGPGDGGGSGGERALDPARPATEEKLIDAKPIEITPTDHPMDRPAAPAVIIPVITVQAQQLLPGAAVQVDTQSPGPGSGPGGEGRRGLGRGPDDGPGVWPGRLGGDGDAPGPGNGVTSPRLIKEVKPNYTVQAMRAKLQGAVEMEAVVLPDGSVDPASIRITRSLDSMFGLDEQATIAVKQWRFRPGTFKGQAVAVRVNVELTFTLR